MSEETEDLKWKLEQMLGSSNSEWVDTVTTTVNAMYRQFQLERESREKVVSFSSAATSSTRQLGVLYKRQSPNRLGGAIPEMGLVLIVF
jgi:hypothetical protein